MGSDTSLFVALIIVLLVVVLFWAYDKCKLDDYLSAKYKKCLKPLTPPAKGQFVGAMAQTAPLVPCAFPVSDDWQMNRCNYM